MKNATIRLVFVLALLCTIGIIGTQVFWVKSAYQLENKDFNLNVNTALRNVAARIWEINNIQPLVYNVVERIEPNYYIVQVNDRFDPLMLEHLLREELEANKIITDFEFANYDCMGDSMATRHYVKVSGNNEEYAPIEVFPPLKRENYYFGIYFPHRSSFVSQQLSMWYYSSIGLLFVILFMAYVVFIIMKQKRLGEVQKDFVNNMAHEFKTPLSAIQLAAGVLKQPEIVNKPQRLLSYATIIDNEAAQLVMQIERVLQTAHSDKGVLHLHKEKFIWQELIKDVSRSFENKVNDKSAQLNLSLPEAPVYFFGDKLHLRNVLSNLIDNALKYSKENPVIDIILENRKNKLRLLVEDNGIGVAKEHQKLLFKKFYRVPTGDVHDVKGFGLGLNYVEIIVKSHGGTIECQSEKGKGTTFVIEFNQKRN